MGRNIVIFGTSVDKVIANKAIFNFMDLLKAATDE